MSARQTLSAAGLLGLAALLAALLLSGVHRLTRDAIAAAEHRARLQALSIVLPAQRYDNDPLEDHVTIVAPGWLGSDRPMPAWRARRAGAPAMIAFEATAPDGYSGDIHLLLSIDAAGHIGAVRVTSHHETPGLGDAIEAGRDGWIERFTGLDLEYPARERWAVRKDGGEFDQFAGATITPRAVVAATRRALLMIERHGAELYAAPVGAEVHFTDAPDLPGEH